MAVLGAAAAETAVWRRPHRIAVEPLHYAAREGAGFGLFAAQPAVELGDAGPLVEEGPPVLARPAVAANAKKHDDARLLPRQGIEHIRRRRYLRLQYEILAVDLELDACGSGRFEGLNRAHIRALQPALFSADSGGKFPSTLSASVSSRVLRELSRTVELTQPFGPSAESPTVRMPGAAKPLS